MKKETLRDKIISCIPGAIVFRKGFTGKYLDNSIARNALITIFGLPAIIVYGLSSYSYNAPMFSKEWFENRKEESYKINQKKIIQQQSTSRQQFHELDKNNDYIIDSTEFIYRR